MSKDKAKFFGTQEQLEYYVASTGIKGTWYKTGTSGLQFKSKYGGALTWWPSTKTIKLVGKWYMSEERKIRKVIDFETKYAFHKAREATKKTTHIEHDIDNMFNSL